MHANIKNVSVQKLTRGQIIPCFLKLLKITINVVILPKNEQKTTI